MPSCYAHYRFGAQLLPTLPEDIRDLIVRHRAMFDLGLQGPDFFFFYRPGMDTPVRKLGRRFHYQKGREFFEQACRKPDRPTEKELAYLYGLMGHYCLDSVCHPLIYELAQGSTLAHNRMESEFDRFLLELDGVKKPHFHDRGRQMKCSRKNCAAAARCYPGAQPRQIWEAMQTMRWILRLLVLYPAAKQVVRIMGGAYPGLLMEDRSDPACAEVNGQLLQLYEKAAQRYAGCLGQLQDHLAFGKPFGEELEGIFG